MIITMYYRAHIIHTVILITHDIVNHPNWMKQQTIFYSVATMLTGVILTTLFLQWYIVKGEFHHVAMYNKVMSSKL